ncbi:transposase [Streptomyces sp. NPDC006314]|uniref:transposase n=1 Tax=Streptomyces sp. NPDC006314 TaxID=3154475 RepID=UPI0033BEC676
MWARLEPLLPTGRKSGRPRKGIRRKLIDGIRWRTRTGAPWRAGRAGTVRAGVRPFPSLAAPRHLEERPR